MAKNKSINVKYKKVLRGRNLNPCVLLTRLTKQDIDRHTTAVRNKYNHISPYLNETDIKEEPMDENEVVTEFRHYEVTFQEIHSRVKIEPVDLDLVKTEPIDMYENTIASSEFTNFYGIFQCKICYKLFNNYEEFVVHKNLDHKDKQQYACNYCNEKFCLNAHLKNHLLVHLDNLRMKHRPLALPSVIQSSSKSDLTNRQKRKFVDEVTNVEHTSQFNNFKCRKCNFITDSKVKLTRHKRGCSSNRNVNSFNCDLCSNSYTNQTALNGHMRYHSLRGDMISKRALRKKGVYIKPITKTIVKPKPKEKKKIFCTVCDKQFVFIKRLERHMQLHKSVKTVNSKQFGIGKLKKHKNVSKTLKFSVKFANPNLKNIEKNHQKNSKPFQCPHCENYYSSKRSLADHNKQFHIYTTITPLLKHNKTPSVKCNYCNVLISKGNLNRHIRSFHSNVQ